MPAKIENNLNAALARSEARSAWHKGEPKSTSSKAAAKVLSSLIARPPAATAATVTPGA